ncbi:hypothetical protein CSUB01_01113 [Colletotrichum sublineola]|uniref:Uncharacterized protein n=1 Tax=Colletotrichum sublineola TaxID=1173701 RepID=A0A066X5E3_COLSU|nr:hypothetical protein CSUB01_01113 [Colletotrichum sublineola]
MFSRSTIRRWGSRISPGTLQIARRAYDKELSWAIAIPTIRDNKGSVYIARPPNEVKSPQSFPLGWRPRRQRRDLSARCQDSTVEQNDSIKASYGFVPDDFATLDRIWHRTRQMQGLSVNYMYGVHNHGYDTFQEIHIRLSTGTEMEQCGDSRAEAPKSAGSDDIDKDPPGPAHNGYADHHGAATHTLVLFENTTSRPIYDP